MPLASSLARNKMAYACSIGERRAFGCGWRWCCAVISIISLSAFAAISGLNSGVSVPPGETELMRMPLPKYWMARFFVSASTPAFAAE